MYCLQNSPQLQFLLKSSFAKTKCRGLIVWRFCHCLQPLYNQFHFKILMMPEISCVPNFLLLQFRFTYDFYWNQYLQKQKDSAEFNCIQNYPQLQLFNFSVGREMIISFSFYKYCRKSYCWTFCRKICSKGFILSS